MAKDDFEPSKAAEREFYAALKKVAKASGNIIDLHTDGATLKNDREMMRLLRGFSESLGPWAERQALKLLNQVQRANRRAYERGSKNLGRIFRAGIGDDEVGALAYALMNEQVGLIKSIPLEAGERAQQLAFQGAIEGRRAAIDDSTVRGIEKQLGLSTEVATSRAKLIAVTETARATASINQVRAQSVGSTHYRWHNSGDEAVRHSHKIYRGKKMQGQVFSWAHPPTLSDGMTGHPGTFPRCRCFAEPIFFED